MRYVVDCITLLALYELVVAWIAVGQAGKLIASNAKPWEDTRLACNAFVEFIIYKSIMSI